MSQGASSSPMEGEEPPEDEREVTFVAEKDEVDALVSSIAPVRAFVRGASRPRDFKRHLFHCMKGVVLERARGGTIVEDSIEALEIERKRLLNALEHLERSCEALREVEEEDKEYADALRENARVEAEIRGKVYELSVKIVERRGTSREESKGGEGADVGTWV